MKKTLSLLLIGLFLSLALVNGVSATIADEKDTVRNHGPFYVGSKPFERYEQPGFICGFYNEIELGPSRSVHYLYSPHLLFGWNIAIRGLPFPFYYSFQLGAFASRVEFDSFNSTFVGFFTGTEPGFVCGFVENNCHFTYGNFDTEVMN